MLLYIGTINGTSLTKNRMRMLEENSHPNAIALGKDSIRNKEVGLDGC